MDFTDLSSAARLLLGFKFHPSVQFVNKKLVNTSLLIKPFWTLIKGQGPLVDPQL